MAPAGVPLNGPKPTVVLTGAAGNLGLRLLPLLARFSIVAIDMKEPATDLPVRFVRMDLGRDESRAQLIALLGESGAAAVVHLAFVIDPVRTGVFDRELMRRINVAGTARVLDAIAAVNRSGGNVRQCVYPSSVSVYGPETPGPVTEDFPLGAHTLPYAIDKQEADALVQARAAELGACSTCILRPHIYAGASVQNYLIGVLRGTATGRGKMAAWLRAHRVRLPLVLPSRNRLDKHFQFVHVDDVARLIAWILRQPERGGELVILNVPGRAPALPLRRCAQIARARVIIIPAEFLCRWSLRVMWHLGISGIPPEALPYMIGSYTMDDGRLRAFLGPDYQRVMQYSVEEALVDSFRDAATASVKLTSGDLDAASPPAG
jgi:nucleoside-diphosphate-sugar epimerase